MRPINNVVRIAMVDCQDALVGFSGTLEEAVRVSMRAALDSWICKIEDEQITAAIGGVLAHYGEGSEEFKRIKWEVNLINKVEAALNAARAGVTAEFPEIEQKYKPIGIIGMWHEVKEENRNDN